MMRDGGIGLDVICRSLWAGAGWVAEQHLPTDKGVNIILSFGGAKL